MLATAHGMIRSERTSEPTLSAPARNRLGHISDMTLRHQATKFVKARITKKNLPAVLDLLDRQKAERPFTREVGLVLLDRLAKVQHRTKSDLAREILRKRIAVERFRELRRHALPSAEAAGYLTDDDIFRDLS